MPAALQNVTDAVVRRAQRQGHVVPSEVRGELKLAGLAESQWKEVIALARGLLHYRQGRYFPVAAVSPRLHQQQEEQRKIAKAVRQLIRSHKVENKQQERRGQARVDFVQPVAVRTEDGKAYTLLSRDVSPSGIRLVGTRRLLGKQVQLSLPQGDGQAALLVVVRILWTCALGEDLFENGGSFVKLVE